MYAGHLARTKALAENGGGRLRGPVKTADALELPDFVKAEFATIASLAGLLFEVAAEGEPNAVVKPTVSDDPLGKAFALVMTRAPERTIVPPV
jgi:hypothetical protein